MLPKNQVEMIQYKMKIILLSFSLLILTINADFLADLTNAIKAQKQQVPKQQTQTTTTQAKPVVNNVLSVTKQPELEDSKESIGNTQEQEDSIKAIKLTEQVNQELEKNRQNSIKIQQMILKNQAEKVKLDALAESLKNPDNKGIPQGVSQSIKNVAAQLSTKKVTVQPPTKKDAQVPSIKSDPAHSHIEEDIVSASLKKDADSPSNEIVPPTASTQYVKIRPQRQHLGL